MEINIRIKLFVEGIHCWSECPIPEVSFLRNPHRHIFHITCQKEVTHNDRDIEIIMFKREVESYLRTKYGTPCDFGGMSCEMIASELTNAFKLSICEVMEDGENGAIITK